jgi:NADH dehydrogenase [ubiquinone] 1 alpha subcomplex assembly factor 7
MIPEQVTEQVAERLDHFIGRANAQYYASHDPFADFTTAPEISQIFGEILCIWAIATWHRLNRPAPFLLVEPGPGRGTLMADIIRTARKAAPDFHAAARVHFIETSPTLRERQASAMPDATWHGSLATVPAGPMILLANEFLDALPIRQFVHRPAGWTERYVANGTWIEQILPPEETSIVPPRSGLRDGTVVEINEPARAFVTAVARRIVAGSGAALFIDYGPAESAAGDSFQAIAQRRMTDPLADPGHADLTAHVDFADLAAQARIAGGQAHGPLTQGAFLGAWGLFDRARSLVVLRHDHAGSVQQAAQRLTDPAQMGMLFKVLAITPPGWPDVLRP